MPIQILVVDDHDVVREGVKAILQRRPDWVICGEASNGREAIALAETLKPDVVVLDVTMPVMNGLHVVEQLRHRMPDVRVVMLTMHDAQIVENAARKSGSHGLVLKLHASRDLVKAVEAILDGGEFFASEKLSHSA